MSNEDRIEIAKAFWRTAAEQQRAGERAEAIRLYHRSLRTYETAEAHTLLGPALSLLDDSDEAVRQCLRAIELDPTRGDAYNDIGLYMVALEREDESSARFRRAKQAEVYDTPELPVLNLARLYLGRGEFDRALLELQAASILAPNDRRVRRLQRWIRGCLAIREQARDLIPAVPPRSA
jgi:tetratricopeptide (TPR) repeat protein